MEALGRPVITAQPGTPCGWSTYGETGTKLTCQGGRNAIHILTKTLPVAQAGTALCAFHSPWDPTDEERAAVGQPFQTMGEAGAARLAERELTASEEAFAEAERDEATGIDTLRELLTLDAQAPTRRAPKLKAVHAADLGIGDDKTTACGMAQVRGRVTMVPESVTCKLCKGTRRYQTWATRVAWRLKEAQFARAGLRREMVIREIGGARRFGVVARIESGGVEIYFWTPDQFGKTYRAFADVDAFDQACEIVILDKMIKVSDRLVSNLGGEAVVLGVTATSVRYRRMGIGTPVDLTASEFAAELSRGFVAVIPTLRVRVSQVIRWNARPHQYGIVTALNGVNPSQATMSVHSLGSDQYGVTLHLDKLAQEIMRGDATISELPIGSWR